MGEVLNQPTYVSVNYSSSENVFGIQSFFLVTVIFMDGLYVKINFFKEPQICATQLTILLKFATIAESEMYLVVGFRSETMILASGL